MSIYILGTSLSHDGATCLIKDGQVIVSIAKERVTRKKHDGGNDSAAIDYCLKSAGIEKSDLTLVVQNTWSSMFPNGSKWFFGPREFPDNVQVVTISHHLAHAYSAFAMSPFEEADVLVIDNGGNSIDECTDLGTARISGTPNDIYGLEHLFCEISSFYHFDDNGFEPITKYFSPPGHNRRFEPMLPEPFLHSIGGFYQAVSHYVFQSMDDPGKLMGLSPFGKRGRFSFPAFDLENGDFKVRYDWQSEFDRPCRTYDQFLQYFDYYADVARWAQDEVEKAILYVATQRSKIGNSANLCYAGGVALNAVANQYLIENTDYSNLFIQPAAGDDGIALGCAYYGWLEVLKQNRILHDGQFYLGTKYEGDLIQKEINTQGVKHLVYDGTLLTKTAQLLAEGATVGWFQGGSEFGPRALGNRSIIADPRSPTVQSRINRNIKKREDFRPFAPSVVKDKAKNYFKAEQDSPYMILVTQVREEFLESFPAITHCDGSARLQTVTREQNKMFYDLLVEFEKRTDIPMLLNTSMNRKGEPMVESPKEAIRLFLESELDALVLNDTLLIKERRVNAS